MYDLKPIAAKNITALRQSAGMTQLELAQKLNYSDKAVSKWERGESVPDISVLYEISRIFGVTVDYLITDHDTPPDEDTGDTAGTAPQSPSPPAADIKPDKTAVKNRAFVTAMSILLVWLVATSVFVILDIVLPASAVAHRLAFVYAAPASVIVWLVLNTVWFSRRRNFLIIALLVWSLLGAFCLTMLTFGYNVWKIMILGIPSTIIIALWSRINRK